MNSNEPAEPISTLVQAPAPAALPVAKKAAAAKPVVPKTAPVAKKRPIKKPAAKQAVATKATTTPKPAKPAKVKVTKQRAPKIKMVRDSFTFPDTEHKVLTDLKKRLIALGQEVKKGELVRVGIALLAAMDDKAVIAALATVDKLKTGRPKK